MRAVRVNFLFKDFRGREKNNAWMGEGAERGRGRLPAECRGGRRGAVDLTAQDPDLSGNRESEAPPTEPPRRLGVNFQCLLQPLAQP